MNLRFFLGLLTAIGAATSAAGAAAPAPDAEFFEKRIRPVLAEQCYECHSATSKKLKGGLRLDSRAALLHGGDTGPAIVPGKPEASLLVTAMAHRDKELTMPPKKPKLADPIISDFERWIREGAAWPNEGSEPTKPAVKADGFDLAERKARLPWLWETPRRQPPPPVYQVTWPLGAIDRFILHRLEKEGLQPAPPAEAALWLRRVSFALTGLPPSPKDVTAFIADRSPDARQRVVDRLLASPQFGERWARHWLDLVRYAESRGHESDYIIPNAYEYRDYVVRAFNADVPYDAFVREHIAGDLLPEPRRHPERGYNESILGTGWAFLGEEIHAPVDTRLDENERIDNRLDVMTKTFLGLTVSCARCHDHKFDAISQRDYYALAGFFISSSQRLARFETLEDERRVAHELDGLRTRWRTKLSSTIAEAQRRVLLRVEDYLAAAAEAARTETNAAPKAGQRVRPAALSPPTTAAVGRLAAMYSLNSRILGQWTAAVLSAANDPRDILHPFTTAALGKRPQPESAPPSNELALPEGARVVVDFGKLGANEWFADGVAFGLQPLRAGELQVVPPAPANTNGRAALRIATRAAAQSDPDWRELDLSPGVEREPGMFGSWKRDGVMLRSPKFQLAQGKLHYLVRGSGRILAAVDSQRLVTGPVHTGQVREWPYRDGWHWVTHDLSDYAGHRVAIEFSPGGEFDTAVALIVEGEKPADPPPFVFVPPQTAAEGEPDSVAALAAAYQESFMAAARSFGARAPALSLSKGPAESWLEIAHWLVQRPELFSGQEGEWPEPAMGSLQQYLQEREPLVRRVQWKSRTAPAMMEGNGVDEYLLVRGKHQTPKGMVPRRFLEAVAGTEPMGCRQGSGRRELAETITDPANPLVARVLVNRVWHHLFGRGLVASVDNFGWLGQRPTHPELLDELAASFIQENRWSLKQLLRRLVLSRTYAMSASLSDEATEQRDPENLLLHRMNLKRLEGEAIRDAMLAVSGRLDRRLYGASVPLHASQFFEARGLRSERGPLDGHGRRSLYVAARRNFLPMMMTAFDTPIPFTTVGRRNVSNVPGQMLFLMNDPFVHQQAGVWAQRLLAESPGASAKERVQHLFLAAFSRQPAAPELERCLATLRQVGERPAQEPASLESWTELCHALLGVKEFIYVR